MMSFSDLQMIFRFLPLFLAIYYVVPPYFRRGVLLIGSLFVYATGDLRYLPLLISSVIFNYFLGLDCLRGKKGSLALTILMDAGLLIAFKSLGAFVSLSFLPVGISFYTFKMISYQCDLYRGRIASAPSFIDTAAYFTLFAQIVSGPIMRYEDYARNTSYRRKRKDDPNRPSMVACMEEGAFYFCLGLSFKVLIADHLAQCWHAIGTIGYAHVSVPLAWMGVVVYPLNLYFDFWGYSLMAAGVGVALGFPFVENFHHPYAARGVADFYRRWHMTLGSWFRDYIYIPMGGSRAGAGRTFINLFVVWLVTGLWHGLTLNFLIWAGVLFVLIVWEKYVLAHVPALMKVLGRVHVLLFVPLTWMPFALGKLSYLTGYMRCLFPFIDKPTNVYTHDYVTLLDNYLPFILAGLVLLVPQVFDTLKRHHKNPLVALICLTLFWASVYSLAGKAGNPFMYFRF